MATHSSICLENPMDGGAWQAAVHGVAKSQTQLSEFTFFLSEHIPGVSWPIARVCAPSRKPRKGGAACMPSPPGAGQGRDFPLLTPRQLP